MFAELSGVEDHDLALFRHALEKRASKTEWAADYWRYIVKLDTQKRTKKYEQTKAWRKRNGRALAAHNASPKEVARKAAYRENNRSAIRERARNQPASVKALRNALERIVYAGMTQEQRERQRGTKRKQYKNNPDRYRAKSKRYYAAHKEALRPKAAALARERYHADPEAARARQRAKINTRIARGLCRSCPARAATGKTACRECLDKGKSKQAMRRAVVRKEVRG
jgi:hypothetical protein